MPFKVSAITPEVELVATIKNSRPWYSKSQFAIFAVLSLAFIDTGGFIQGVLKGLPDSSRMSELEKNTTIFAMIIMVIGFIVAFEVSTLYIAYAFSLKLYHYDKYAIKRINSGSKNVRLSKFISTSSLGWISFFAFVLGVIANIIFRIGLMENIDFFNNNNGRLTIDGSLTFIMILLPIITSIMNFVIGCFTFDPILFELSHISKALGKLKIKKDNLKNERKRIDDEIKRIDEIKKSHEKTYNSKIYYAQSLRLPLRTRIYEKEIKNA